MPAARYDLIIDQGSDFSLELTIKDNETAKDLREFSGRAHLRKTKEATGSPAATFTVTKGGPNSDGETGIIKLSLAWSNSVDLKSGLYYYDFEIYEPAENSANPDVQVIRILYGTAHIRREVTR